MKCLPDGGIRDAVGGAEIAEVVLFIMQLYSICFERKTFIRNFSNFSKTMTRREYEERRVRLLIRSANKKQ